MSNQPQQQEDLGPIVVGVVCFIGGYVLGLFTWVSMAWFGQAP